MAMSQATDPQVRALQSYPTSTLVMEAVPITNSPHPLYCDTSTVTERLVVPLPGTTLYLTPYMESLTLVFVPLKTDHILLCLARYQL